MGYTFIKSDKEFLIDDIGCKKVIRYKDIIAIENFNDKFINDKIFFQDDEFIIILDGVIFNFKDLSNKNGIHDNINLIKKLFKRDGIRFIKELRGNFSGIIYSKSDDLYYAFTNHLGNKFCFYSLEDKNEIVSTDIFEIVKYRKRMGLNVNEDNDGINLMLTFGYMFYNKTLIKQVKKILPGCYLKSYNGSMIEEEYYKYDNTNIQTMSEDVAMREMNERFLSSIKLSFNKDLEYGYDHLGFLSGGMDSRMILIAAHSLGYKNINCITFSENYSLDELISREIANDFKFNGIIKSLNNGLYLENIDKCIESNSGEIVYCGAAHAVDSISKINLDRYGMIHNGNLADIMHGDYISADKHTKINMTNWAYSKRLYSTIEHLQKEAEKLYLNEEHFAIYNRGINGILNGSISLYDKLETAEDFMDPDIVDFSMQLDPKYKYRENLFIKMVNKYYPEAVKYKWQRWNARPKDKYINLMEGNFGRVYKRLSKEYYSLIYKEDRLNMNPFDVWYKNNINLKNTIEGRYSEKIDLVSDSIIRKNCIELFENGCFTEKAQVITVLEVLDRINKIK